ncbi:ABC transporter substrate-binding protein [Subtercola boreus]|uniref:ABC transporter substrate-binding protein n=1 Tax=Subtercola boreus TaxID=120213 RepID=A0A3E0VH73_9MICO|nr:extracellular solute-binding protein [Subtercola boreus]RFA09071.1 ABC transporter substrate-binding protein [Subtercola boreus]TQL53926.1 carbohydrate ABC transporter substrate-binding protein (CUT1 family) [Subtercola boreus]
MQRSTKRWLALGAVIAAGSLALTGCSGSSFDSGAGSSQNASAPLTVLIGSSGDAETKAVTDAVASWSSSSGTQATVTAASDLNQQLSQGFASGKPADVFYVSTDALAGYAANGSLLAYGDKLANKDDFYPTLVKSFTYDGQFYCAPKDFSTLGLVINKDLWAQAGLTDADVPTTWDQLSAVAQKLTTADHAGLSFSPEYARVGAFMAEAGGGLVDADGTAATANSDASVAGLSYVKSLLTSGAAKYSSTLGAGWGGEAFGKGLAAMTIEGNWITGAMKADYPNVNYMVAELPAGTAGQGTLQFSNCWGIAADSPNQDAALKLVEQLTSTEQQLTFAEAFGVMPSVQSAAAEWKSANPALAPFLDSATFATGVPTAQGSADVIKDLNSQLESLETSDPKAILDSTQKNLEAVVGK